MRLAEKESIIKHLLSAKDKLRVDSDDKFQKLEDGNRELVLSLDEANMKCKDQELGILRLSGEIESLKERNVQELSARLKCRKNCYKFCNQALAHEESWRKSLEVQLAESNKGLECVSSKWEETQSKIECLTTQRDKDIETLRNSLAMKETENVELLQSLKELQESQIQGAASASSSAKLHNKLKGPEQVHKNCSTNLKNKEAEWNSQPERLKVDLDKCRSDLCSRDLAMEQLHMELQGCHSAVMQFAMQYEEASLMLMVLKAGFSEARAKVYDEVFEKKLHYKEEFEGTVALLRKQLIEAKGAAEEACS
ncbi:hypothetical protein RJ641_011582 [Dillenia turbinata]|uniref:Uncharacterized protein n=1 Tax=Dillenia turbinata TaxID=194707 RepID=A0AAN8V8P0_9MAGN